MIAFRALNDPCRGGEQDDPDQDARLPLLPDEPHCGCCGAPEGQPCDAGVHEAYEEALASSWCEPAAPVPCPAWTPLEAIRAELAELGPARPIPPDPKRAARVAEIIAWKVLYRWQASGVARAYLDGQGAPVPLLGEAAHEVKVVQGRTSPSGKTLFGCARCEHPEQPVPPRGPCGRPAQALLYPVRDYLLAGGRFEPDAAGILRPVC